MKAWVLMLCAALLCGCAGQATVRNAPPQLFHDSLFQPPAAPIDSAAVFALSDSMRTYLQEHIIPGARNNDVRRVLFDALYRKDKLQLDYDAATTRNAAETFDARAGNCLSLAIMTAALARELKLVVQFQQVDIEESWSRNGKLYFASNHVNLMLGKPRISHDSGVSLDLSNALTVDFIPIPEKARQNARPLEERTIVAMFMNNRAAELLAADQVDDAYWAARQAVAADPAFQSAYNTLGVVYQHHRDHALAEQVLRYALTLGPDNTILLSNLAQTLDSQDKTAEAAALRQRLAQLEPYPPFYFFNLGQQAMEQGDYGRARNMFEREIERVPDYHEFQFWLAIAYYRLGNVKAAETYMAKALEQSTTRGAHDLYAAKLDRLRAYESHPPSK